MATEPGLFLIDKPVGRTSHDVVVDVRRATGIRKVGHTGTLDPFASGLLIVLVGPFTRLARWFHDLTKTYEATLELGRETDTGDPTGETVREGAWADLEPARVRDALVGMVGDLFQVPSAYSAKKVEGRRAYDAARRGEALALEPVPVTVHELEITGIALPEVRFRLRVSTGTYVRAIARDAGRELGCGGHLSALRRTEVGPFRVADAADPPDVGGPVPGGAAVRRGAAAVPWWRRRALDPDEVEAVGHGRPVPIGELTDPARGGPEAEAGLEGAPVALVAGERLVAAAVVEGEWLRPRRVLTG